MLRAIILVGIGGAMGSIFRYLTTMLVSKYIPAIFPWSTFMVNVLGCFLAGLIMGVLDKHLAICVELRLLLITGFCGGFTTFSAFTYENISLVQAGNGTTALIYILSSVTVSLAAILLGFILAR